MRLTTPELDVAAGDSPLLRRDQDQPSCKPMRYTHAIVSRLGGSVSTQTGTGTTYGGGIDMGRARKDQESLLEALREAGVSVIELPPESQTPVQSLFVEDCAVVVNGTALVARPGHESRRDEVYAALNEMDLHIQEVPADKRVMLECSDVLFTGREFFVGMTKWTNESGAREVARTFPEFPVTAIRVTGQKHLKHYVAVAGNEVLAVGASREAQNVLKRIEREAQYRYSLITLKHDEAVNCIFVNNVVLFRSEFPDCVPQFQKLDNCGKHPVSFSELCKIGGTMSQHCLLFRRLKVLSK